MVDFIILKVAESMIAGTMPMRTSKYKFLGIIYYDPDIHYYFSDYPLDIKRRRTGEYHVTFDPSTSVFYPVSNHIEKIHIHDTVQLFDEIHYL